MQLQVGPHPLQPCEKAVVPSLSPLSIFYDNAVRGLLTPDQQVKFDAMKALREQGPAGGRWMGHGAMAPFGGEGGR